MPKKSVRRVMGQPSLGNNKVAFDRFWLSIGIPIIVWVFSAGIGWNKLSYAENNLEKLSTKFEAAESNKFDTNTRLVTLDQRLQEMNRNLDRLSATIEALAKVKSAQAQ